MPTGRQNEGRIPTGREGDDDAVRDGRLRCGMVCAIVSVTDTMYEQTG
jgi:hypothetical protein